jgi:hypothetical protein
MSKVFAGLCLSLFVVVSASTLAADEKAPPLPAKDAKGMIKTSEFLDYAAYDLKPKLFGDEKALACVKLKPGTLDKPYNAAAKSCKKKLLKDVPPVIRPPFELDRVAGPYSSCIEKTMLEKQGVSRKQHYECMHPEQKQ